MPGYLIDTQTISYWYDGNCEQFRAVTAAVQRLAPDSPLYLSAITLGEIEYGHASNPAGAGARRDEFVRFVRTRLPQVLEVSKHTAEPYGRIRAHLAEKFPPPGGWSKKKRAEQFYDPVAARELHIDENDLWLVAQAVERNLWFVTSDRMRRVKDAVAAVYPEFRCIDWATGEPC